MIIKAKAGKPCFSFFALLSYMKLQINLHIRATLVIGVLLSMHHLAMAGYQREEQISYAVRVALSRAIANSAPPKPIFNSYQEEQQFNTWLQVMSGRLAAKIPDDFIREDFLNTVWYEATRAGLDPSMVLGLIQVESNFRKYAVSPVGARGFMQVMPFWTRVIGDGDPSKLFHMQSNLRYGCTILRHYIDREGGNLFLALGRYNGSRGKSAYPNAVHQAWKKWML